MPSTEELARPSRRSARAGVALAFLTALLLPSPPIGPAATAGTEAVPDLAVAPLIDFRIQWSGGRRLLRFSSTMVNVGPGHFELRGTRATTADPMAVHQVTYQTTARDSPLAQDIVTPATASWSGDGHNHWHINEMVRFDMWGAAGNLRGSKIGFCFLDTDPYDFSLPGASSSPFYGGGGCGNTPAALAIRMGMSIGWGDKYGWFLPMQWVDITDLPAGSYTVRARVDPHGYFFETDETNQCAYVDVTITDSDTATVTNSGFGCVDDWTGTPFAGDIAWAFSTGVTLGCTPDLFCPHDPVTREQMASFLVRAMGLMATQSDFFVDDEGSIHEDDINRLAAAGITLGCAPGHFCPTSGVSRDQMASFLVRAFSVPSTVNDHFTDDTGSIHEGDINSLAESQLTFGCGGTSFCPAGAVSREQMVAFLHRVIGG